MKGVSVVGFPLYTLAGYAGMGRAPDALRRSGLVPALGRSVCDYGDVQIPLLENDIVEDNIKNLSHFRAASARISREASRLEPMAKTICLGGECSFTIGALAGFKSVFKGKPGMLWIDSHGDFNTPETSPSGYIGGMCLAMACGKGPTLGDPIEKERPLLEEEALVHLGSRALDPAERETMRGSAMGLVTMKKVSLDGILEVSSKSARRLADSSDWIVCHLDVDVLDRKIMPAVNYPTSGGMTVEQAVVAIRALDATGKLKVLEVSAYNPELDRHESSAGTVVRLIQEALSH